MNNRESPATNAPTEPIGRIYLVTPGGTRALGGIGRMVSYIYRTWREPGAPITIVDSYGPGAKIRMPFYFFVAYLRILFAALTGKIGLLHIHMSERLSVFRKGMLVHLGSAFNIPVVLHLHGADFADYCRGLPPHRLRRVQRMMAKADAIIALGGFWRDFVRDEMHIDPARIVVLHNAVPGPDSLPDRSGRGTCRILFLGVVCERKGVPTLLAALANPSLLSLDWHADIAGNGDVEKFKNEAKQLGLAGRVSFLGWIDEAQAKRLLVESDILALPSRNEGLPMAILEAMAYGLPVVATPVGSIADAIIDDDTGRLVPVGDSGALVHAFMRLVQDPALRERFGERARQRYLDMFEIGAFNAKLARIFSRAKQHLPIEDETASTTPLLRQAIAGGNVVMRTGPIINGAEQDRALLSPLVSCATLLSRLAIVHDDNQKEALLSQLASPQKPTVLSFLNQHAFNLSWNDTQFGRWLRDADVLLRDGVGVSVALSLLRCAPGLNLNGTDLIPVIADRYAGRRVMLLGTDLRYANSAAAVLRAKGCHVVAVMDGFADDQNYVAAARTHRPELIILGMGMPKQERVAAQLSQALDYPVLIVNGGAILDFLAERFQRAPTIFIQLRLEWAYRLLLEPRRLARRYVLGGVLFVARILRLKFSGVVGRDRRAA